jgi:hypothetical protein
MPPGEAERLPSKEAFERHYRRALKAIGRCCVNPDLQTPSGDPVCHAAGAR